MNMDECLSQPCHNNGTCHDLINAFTCSCLAGFFGNDCSIVGLCRPRLALLPSEMDAEKFDFVKNLVKDKGITLI